MNFTSSTSKTKSKTANLNLNLRLSTSWVRYVRPQPCKETSSIGHGFSLRLSWLLWSVWDSWSCIQSLELNDETCFAFTNHQYINVSAFQNCLKQNCLNLVIFSTSVSFNGERVSGVTSRVVSGCLIVVFSPLGGQGSKLHIKILQELGVGVGGVKIT